MKKSLAGADCRIGCGVPEGVPINGKEELDMSRKNRVGYSKNMRVLRNRLTEA